MKISLRTVILLVACAIPLAALTLGLNWLSTLLVLGLILGSLAYLALKADSQRRVAEELTRAQAAYTQLDQQTKLIIRSDLELHRTQEELDHKLASLFALHELGQQLRIGLSPDQIYGKVNAHLVTSFGFSKGLVGMSAQPGQLEWQAIIGLDEETAEQIRQYLRNEGLLKTLQGTPAPRLFTLKQVSESKVKRLLELLGSSAVVVAGIHPHTGPTGCLLLARAGLGAAEGRGDEELVAILTTHLATAIENSAMYEELWQSRQTLEQNIQSRTRELAEANTQLIQLNKAKSTFVSAVSHELRTPLAAIKGYAALLRAGQFGRLATPQVERLAKIEKHTDLLTRLITNLLDIARIESGRVTMEQRPIAVREFVATALDVIKPQLDAKHITLTTNVDGVTQVVGDPTHLPRVLMNLLSNAVQYTPEGGTVKLLITQRNQEILTEIQDTGCGIEPSELPKLFQEFYRASSAATSQTRGTGLGLALVKRIVEAHHGHVWVDSTPGQGSTFSFTLPVPAQSATTPLALDVHPHRPR